jgi:hypothetical protein
VSWRRSGAAWYNPRNVNESERAAWAAYRVALAALIVTIVFSGLGAILSFFSLRTAQTQLAIDRQPMAVVDCTFPQKGARPDYVVSLNRGRNPLPIMTTAWLGAYTVPDYTSAADCRVQNYGKYPLINLTFVLDVGFSRVITPGRRSTFAPHFSPSVTVEGVAADSTEHVFVVNDDVCYDAAISLEGQLSFLNVPYQKPTSFVQPGRRTGPGQDTFLLNAVALPPLMHRNLEKAKAIDISHCASP